MIVSYNLMSSNDVVYCIMDLVDFGDFDYLLWRLKPLMNYLSRRRRRREKLLWRREENGWKEDWIPKTASASSPSKSTTMKSTTISTTMSTRMSTF